MTGSRTSHERLTLAPAALAAGGLFLEVTMTSEIRYITVNGARLGYQVHSEGSGKPAVVFVHGYSGRATGGATYPVLLRALAEAFTIYALDLRGHGASASQVEGFSMTTAADDVAAVVQELGLTGSLYIGHSFGGFTGMYCEVRHPGSFSAMCLLATGAAGGGGHAGPDAGQFLIEHGKDREALRQAITPMYLRDHDVSAQIEAVMLMDRGVHKAYFAEYIHRSILEDVRNIQIPVLVLNGALDNVVPLWSQHETALALPLCKEVVFTTEGHMLPRESGDVAAREILAFWNHDVPALQRAAQSGAR